MRTFVVLFSVCLYVLIKRKRKARFWFHVVTSTLLFAAATAGMGHAIAYTCARVQDPEIGSGDKTNGTVFALPSTIELLNVPVFLHVATNIVADSILGIVPILIIVRAGLGVSTDNVRGSLSTFKAQPGHVGSSITLPESMPNGMVEVSSEAQRDSILDISRHNNGNKSVI
ncbi:hypothetical protein D9758_017579 [Tetrapyrgos nigripes]|uniref:Uncharacterized protein n=1 Tax=Tetrapyrgos nigripes TaxID=182062 RepID=A0A8H5CBK2_9AGAR|nr:hypothetical protein D9758_017579 [Tetrapyrgos nigripes]